MGDCCRLSWTIPFQNKAHLHNAIFLATCNAILLLRDLKLTNTRLHYILLMYSLRIKYSSLSLVHTCRKDRGFSPSDVCETVPYKTKYGASITSFSKVYIHIKHSLNYICQKTLCPIFAISVNQALVNTQSV